MGQIKILLWDIDGTILNFIEAEKAAIRTGFRRFEMGECTDEMLSVYSKINQEYWMALEAGTYTKQEILIKRFEDFFSKYNLDDYSAQDFNSHYQVDLGDTICFNDNSFELLCTLKGQGYRQFAVTNGTAIAQKKKLSASGLDKVFEYCYISDELGVEKPNKGFFDKMFAHLRSVGCEYDRDEIMIIGDSLTSDIAGGNNADILTCWYNPEKKQCDRDVHIDYEISNLEEIMGIIHR